MPLTDRLARVRKALIAVATAVSSILALGLVPDGYAKWAAAALTVLGAFGVYATPNATADEPIDVAAALTPPKTPHAVQPAAAPWPGITVSGVPKPAKALGRRPAKNAPSLKFADHLTSIPDHPIADLAPSLPWPMDHNDTVGCCLIEGTEVGAANISAGFRVAYDGPVVSLRFASGKHLTVTPNHAVLTPRGFTRARFLEEGDYAIGADWTEEISSGILGQNGDDAVAPVEQKIAALLGGAAGPGKVAKLRKMVRPVDFHGDGRYMHGDVDVVRTYSLLEREVDAALSQPYGDDQVCPTGELQGALHGQGSTLQPGDRRRFASYGGDGGSSDLGSFVGGHAGVPQTQAGTLLADRNARVNQQSPESNSSHSGFSGQLGVRSLASAVTLEEQGKVGSAALESEGIGLCSRAARIASAEHPSVEGGFTDPEVASYLLDRFPGLVTADRLVSVERLWYSGHVYDLSTETRWYAANGIITHNCVVAGLDHFRQTVYTLLGAAYTPWTDSELLKLYQTQNPTFRSWADGGTSRDQGMDIQTLLEYLTKQGVILGFAKVDHTSVEEMKAAIYLGLGVVTGETLTSRNMSELMWDYHRGDYPEGGHCTVSVGYHPGESQVSWGSLYGMTDAFLTHNVEEAWFVITQAHVDHPAFRAGFDLAGFAAAYQEITGATFPVPTPPVVVPPVVPPVPPVVPPVTADADDVRLWAAIRTWTLGGHGSTTRAPAAELVDWAGRKGLT